MSVLANQPANIKYLNPTGFRFQIKRLPNVNYFLQGATLPSVSVGSVEYDTPFGQVPQPGDKIIFDPLSIRFKVDEDLRNWIEIYDWLQALGRPASYAQTRNFVNSNLGVRINHEQAIANLLSDATLTILTSHKNASMNVFFEGCFPMSLSELSFDTAAESIVHLEAMATFRYRRFTIERI